MVSYRIYFEKKDFVIFERSEDRRLKIGMFEFIIKFVEKVWNNGGKIYFKEIVIFVDKIDDKFVF